MADSPNDERMDDDDDLEESDPAAAAVDLDELRNLLEELISTRPDVQTPSGRNARIQLATEALRKAQDGRQLLARMGKGACASVCVFELTLSSEWLRILTSYLLYLRFTL